MDSVFISGLWLILVLAPIGCAAWMGMLYVLFKMLDVNPKEALDDITLAEAILFGSLSFSAAYLVGALFSRFI